MIRILGFDPGTRICGYGLIDFDPAVRSMALVECGTLEPGEGDASARLGVLGADARELVQEFTPVAAGIEKAHVGVNPQSSLRIAEARGVLVTVLSAEGVPFEEYQPSTVKLSVTGSGRASKETVQAVIMRLLHLARPPKLDATDALAMAVCRALRWKAAA